MKFISEHFELLLGNLVFNTRGTSQFGTAATQVLSGHLWPADAVLESAAV